MKNQSLKIVLFVVFVLCIVGFCVEANKRSAATVVPPIVTATTTTATSTGTSTSVISTSTPVTTAPGNPTPVVGPVIINLLSPDTGSVGTTVTIYGSGFIASNKVLLDGNVGAADVHLGSFTNGHQSITFTIPSAIGPNCKPDQACPMYMRLVTNGTYQVAVENDNGTSNALSLAITGGTSVGAGIQ